MEGLGQEEDGASIASGSSLLPFKRSPQHNMSPRSPLTPLSQGCDSIDLAMEDSIMDKSIDHLYTNIYEMASSDVSPSLRSFTTYGNESRIDAELRHLAGADTPDDDNDDSKTELVKDVVVVTKGVGKGQPARAMPLGRRVGKGRTRMEANHPDLGPYLLKKARGVISHGGNPKKAFELVLRAKSCFEKLSEQDKKISLDYVMCLHTLASMHCALEEYEKAVPLLERSIEISHALAKFAGCMRLGDVYAVMGKIDLSISLYKLGLEIQRQVLGEGDARFGDTCRYVAQAFVQALEFDEAERLCQLALNTHIVSGSIEEAADRRLMGLICDSKGDYENALQHYSLASIAMSSKETEKASIECNIGDAYLALARYDEAAISYQKALDIFNASKGGESHPGVASVFVRLAELNYKVGKFGESKSYCESALQIYNKPSPGSPLEEISTGLIELAAIYESMDELELSLKLLQKALKTYETRTQGTSQLRLIAGVEAQKGVTCYMLGNYNESYNSLKSAVLKFKSCGEKPSLQGIALNQLGITCLRLCEIAEAAELFEEARSILQKEYGLCHPDTLGVCSNLAAAYDVLGKWDEAIEILEFVVEMREEKLGTADPAVDDEKKRLADMLKESRRGRTRKARSLEFLLDM